MDFKSSHKAIWIALFANLSIFIVKFISSRLAGSAAMFSEALHSLADLFSSIFLLVGLRLSLRPPDDEHPFGYGKEVYFWSFVASVFMLGVTSTGSITKGYHSIVEGELINNFFIPLMALLISIIFEIVAVYFAMLGVLKDVNWEVKGWRMITASFKAIRKVTNPAVKFVYFEDMAALFGVVLAFIALSVAGLTEIYILDGIASILIGLILGVLALLLAIENRELIIGRSAQDNVEQAIGDLAMKVRHVKDVHSLKTMYVGPRNLLVNMEVEVHPRMRVGQSDEIIEDIEKAVRHHLPIAKHFSIEILADDQHKDWYTRDEKRTFQLYRRKTSKRVE
jgi:cation diffusion facilitator family transporter